MPISLVRPFTRLFVEHRISFVLSCFLLFTGLVFSVTYYAPLALQTTTITYHLHKEASSTSGHYQLKTAAVDSTSLAIQSADLKAGATGHKLVKSFHTQSNVPNLPGTIASGQPFPSLCG